MERLVLSLTSPLFVTFNTFGIMMLCVKGQQFFQMNLLQLFVERLIPQRQPCKRDGVNVCF